MGLSSTTASQSSSLMPIKGLLVSKATIKDIKFEYDSFLTNDNGDAISKDKFDIIAHIELDIDKDFYPVVSYMGSYKRDGRGTITGWGTARQVGKAFEKLGVSFDVNDEGKVADISQFSKLKTVEVYKTTYASGRKDDGSPKWKSWKNLFLVTTSEEADLEAIKEEFLLYVTKGWVQNFTPEVLEDRSSEFNFGANRGSNPVDAVEQLPDGERLEW